ncbi:MAG: ATP-binding protein [Bifidobacteriaceae bacterium]|jgi:predicted AAA+ superfamily ATPase|nr:ATP-binding protein [Bifidobacteriaceae bacterium]
MNNMIKRNTIDVAIDMLSAFPSVSLNGARQVGKSTFAGQIINKIGGEIVNLDDDNILVAAENDAVGFLRQYENSLLVIDEVQRFPRLTLAIKREIDRNRRSGRFLLTGSSNILKMRQNPESLAGRTVDIDMYGFSQGELSGVKEDFVKGVLEEKDLIKYKSCLTKKDYAKKLFAGQYPVQNQFRNNRQKSYWYNSYIKYLLTKDLKDISSHLIPERLNRILKIVAANQAGELVVGRIADKLTLRRGAIENYVNTLETMNIIETLPVYSSNLTSKVVFHKKSIVLDTGLCMYLNGLNNDNILAPQNIENFGGQFEGFIIGELLRQRVWSEIDYNLYYYRNIRKEEIDVIIELYDGRVILIEIKSSSTHKYDSFHNIKKLSKAFGSKFVAGFVMNTAEDVYSIGKNMWSVPASLLWEIGFL